MSSVIVDPLVLAHAFADRETLEDLIRAGWKRGARRHCHSSVFSVQVFATSFRVDCYHYSPVFELVLLQSAH